MSANISDALQTLPIVSLYLNRIVPVFQLTLGTLGNILNILIFTRPALRTNPCAFYFLFLSINNLFVLYIALLTRLLSSGWNIDPSNSNTVLCKLRIYFVYCTLSLIQWCVVLASVDRFLSSCRSVRYRQLSNLQTAKKLLIFTIVIVFVAHFHTLVWWTSDYIGTDLYCNIFLPDYEMVFQMFFLLFTCILPPILMTIFGVLTIHNVKKSRTQVMSRNNPDNNRVRSKDLQLVRMLLIQVLITILCSIPFSAVNLNDTISKNTNLSANAVIIKSFFANFFRIIYYFNPVIGFFVYTLSSRTFRTEMRSMFSKSMKDITRKIRI